MKTTVAVGIIAIFLLGFNLPTYASDWDTAGKILTGIEGMRLITGGKVDIIGSLTGINNNNSNYWGGSNYYSSHSHNRYCDRKWVSDYTWRKKYIPRHTTYDSRRGRRVIGGYYVDYKVDRGGYWDYSCSHNRRYQSSRRNKNSWHNKSSWYYRH